MTWGELKELLKDVPDESIMLVPSEMWGTDYLEETDVYLEPQGYIRIGSL